MAHKYQGDYIYNKESFIVLATGPGMEYLYLDPSLILSTIKPIAGGDTCEATFINGSLHERVVFYCSPTEVVRRFNEARGVYCKANNIKGEDLF